MLAHKLAARGGRTVRELMAGMDAREWARWRAFDEVSPLGDERVERMLALVGCLIANQWRGEGSDPATVDDLLPDHGGARAEAEAAYKRSEAYRREQAKRVAEGFEAYTGRRAE